MKFLILCLNMNNLTIICSRFNEDIHWTKPFIKNLLVYNKGLENINYIPKSNILNLPNCGREGGSYLHFIINNYDSLPEHMLFIQGHPFDHIYNKQIKRSLNEIKKICNKKTNFEYLSKHKIYLKKNEYSDFRSGIPSLKNSITNICITKQKLIQQIDNLKFIGKQILDLRDNVNSLDKETLNINDFLELIKNESYFNSDKIGQPQRDFLMSHFKDPILDEIIKHRYYFGYGALFLTSRENILRRPLTFWTAMYENFNNIKPGAGWGLEKMWHLILNDYYEKVQWLESQTILNITPLEHILINNKELLNETNIIYITKKINNKYIYYKERFKKTILVSKDNRKGILNHFGKSYPKSINKIYSQKCKHVALVYLGNLSKLELENCMEVLTNLYNNFFIILENYIKNDEFYLNNRPFHYLYYKMKDNPNFSVVGTFTNLLLCKFESK